MGTIITTGITAGLDDRSYIDTVIKMAKLDRTHLQTFDLVDMLEGGSKKLHRLLGSNDYQFAMARECAYRRIGMEMMRSSSENVLIRVPATLPWRGINMKMKDHKIIKETLNPDAVITLIDAEWIICERLANMSGDGFMDQLIEDGGGNLVDVLSWMNEEVSIAEDWAKHMNIPHHVIPAGQHPLSVYKLIKYPNVPSWYVSYSMTHADVKIRRQINNIIKRLCEYGLVIDPQCIEIPKKLSEQEEKLTYAYTVHRDLHWFVSKVSGVVAIHPYTKRPPLSTGMMDELGHARDYLIDRYMIYPPEHVSPFTSNSYIEPGCIFKNADIFFEYLEQKGFKKLKFRSGVTDVPWKANPLKDKC